MKDRLRGMLGCEEIENDGRLRMILAVLLLFFCASFNQWSRWSGINRGAPDVLNYIPTWPLQTLPPIFFLDAFWTRTYLLCLALLALLATLTLYARKDVLFPMAALPLLTVNKLYFYLGDARLLSSHHHAHLMLTVLFLIGSPKLFFFRVGLWTVYVLSILVKMTPSWLQGEFFMSLPGGLPLMPHTQWFLLGMSWSVIGLELFAPMLWLSSRAELRYASFAFLLLLHAYSCILIGPEFPSLMLPALVAAFSPFDRPLQQGYSFSRRQWPAWGFVLLLVLGGGFKFSLPGDWRVTAEGRDMSVFMLEANHHVLSEIDVFKGPFRYAFIVEQTPPIHRVIDKRTLAWVRVIEGGRCVRSTRLEAPFKLDGQVLFNPLVFTRSSAPAYHDPYIYCYYANAICARFHPRRVSVRMWIWLDGHTSAYRVLDIDDFERLRPRYDGLAHNDWIRVAPPETPPTLERRI